MVLMRLLMDRRRTLHRCWPRDDTLTLGEDLAVIITGRFLLPSLLARVSGSGAGSENWQSLTLLVRSF